jgi:hypothetical protein
MRSPRTDPLINSPATVAYQGATPGRAASVRESSAGEPPPRPVNLPVQPGGADHWLLRPFDRWTAGRKHDAVIAVRGNLLTREQLFAVHGITGDELNRWSDAYEREGIAGLRALRRRRAA